MTPASRSRGLAARVARLLFHIPVDTIPVGATLAAKPRLAQHDQTVALMHAQPLECRARCAACCVAPSIASPIPGMPEGKPAGVPCVQLDEHLRCKLFGKPERPAFCASLRPSMEMCGNSRGEALAYLANLEVATRS